MQPSCHAQVARLVVVCSSFFGASHASAQWTAEVVSPNYSFNASLTGTSGTQHVGTLTDTYLRAALWTSASTPAALLAPVSSRASVATGVSGGVQCGWAELQTFPSTIWIPRAGIWSGTAASWVSLHPASAGASHAYGISGTKQVGSAGIGGIVRASLWTGTAASHVDLHPAVASESVARAVSQQHEVGSVVIAGVRRAARWAGTAASYTDLHPTIASSSEATCTSNGVHGGWATVGGAKHAFILAAAPSTSIDLHPAGATASEVRGIGAGVQVGDVANGPNTRAAVWTGTAANWQDLSLALPAGIYDRSSATSVWSDGTTLFVAGSAREIASGLNRAIVWRRPAGFIGCGVPAAGSCCESHPTPYCGNAACCEVVCAADIYCCEVQWDSLCAKAANATCLPCLCPADLDASGAVGAADLTLILDAWGSSSSSADLNDDGTVGAADITELLNAWGPC